ncbi:Bax inhibitor-1/YccA family protein [Magnetococcales bacterium HHB-1]
MVNNSLDKKTQSPWGAAAATTQADTMSQSHVQGDAIAYLKQVYAYLGTSLIIAFAAGSVGMESSFAAEHRIIMFILMVGVSFLPYMFPSAPTLFLATGVWGFAAGPLIAFYVNRGMADTVGLAALLSGAIFFGLSFYAMTTKKDLSWMGGMLLAGLIVLLVGGLLNMFIFQSPAITFAMAAGGTLIFSGFLLWETKELKDNPWAMAPAAGAFSLFTSLFNLFISLLQLLGFLGDD